MRELISEAACFHSIGVNRYMPTPLLVTESRYRTGFAISYPDLFFKLLKLSMEGWGKEGSKILRLW